MSDSTHDRDGAVPEDHDTYCSLVFDNSGSKTRESILSTTVHEGRQLVEDDGPRKSLEELDASERDLFQQILVRGVNESKYQVVKQIAKGGMGVIYCVYDCDIRRHTILKVVIPEYKGDIDIIKRFVYEARVTGELEHPNIVPLHDFGYLEGYGIFFSMTYLQGESLFAIIKRLKIRDPEFREKYDFFTLINIFRKVCDAVAYAHSKGIIHRDIKPENIMVGQFGEVVLMDWGLAKRLAEAVENDDLSTREIEVDMFAEPGVTLVGQIKGTPVYLSPEQASGRSSTVDVTSDIFLLGATLYHMFTFTAPYVSWTIEEAVSRARECDYTRPETIRTGSEHLSRELCSIINRAMAANKEDRYHSVTELIQDIDDISRGRMAFETVRFPEGDLLLEEGAPGSNCYIIQSGKVEVFRHVSGRRVSLGTLEPGDIVGEMALITAQPRVASVVALEETETVVLNKDVFIHNLKKLPSWMEKSILALAQRLSDSNVKLTDTIIFDRNEPDIGQHPFRL